MSRVIVAALVALALYPMSGVASDAPSERPAIRALLHGMFDRPQHPLAVDPIVVSGDYAIADWTQGEMGGRALLKSDRAAWELILCAGDGIRTKAALMKAGVPSRDAERLEYELARTEADLAPEQVAKFSRFEGFIMGRDAEGHRPEHTK